jgi:dTDP-4-amino-4,6-dideoxygalactose transaminase
MQEGSWGHYQGPALDQLSIELQARLAVENAYPVCSGTFATELALRMLKIGPGDEVVLAAYDFAGNFRAIEAVGARPVLVDIAPQSWQIDPTQFAKANGPHVKAVIVSHLHGELAPMPEIMSLAQQLGWRVVEDACQVPGATIDDRPAGSWGDVGTVSFGGSKLLTAGRGGAVLTNSAQFLQRAKVFCEQGNHAYPLSELQAIVLLPQLAQLTERTNQRSHAVQRVIAKYQQATAELGAPPLQPSLASVQGTPAYYKMGWRVLRHASCSLSELESFRDKIAQALQAEGLVMDAGFRGLGQRSATRCRKVGELPHAAAAAASTLVLHHPILLREPEILDRLAVTIAEIAHHFAN